MGSRVDSNPYTPTDQQTHSPDEQVICAEGNALVQARQVRQLLTLLGLQGTQVMQPNLWTQAGGRRSRRKQGAGSTEGGGREEGGSREGEAQQGEGRKEEGFSTDDKSGAGSNITASTCAASHRKANQS